MASSSYSDDELVWCVTRAKLIPQWQNLFYFYRDPQTWLFGSILFFSAMILIFLYTSFEAKPLDAWTSILLIVQTVVGNTSTFQPKITRVRILWTIFCFDALLITTYYNAFVMNFLISNIYKHQISSVDEIIQNDFKLSGYPFALKHLMSQKEFGMMNEGLRDNEFCDQIDECLNDLEFNMELAVAVNRRYIDSSPSRDFVFCFDSNEVNHNFPLAFLIRKDFRHLLQFNDLLEKLIEAGLVSKWLRDYYHPEEFLANQYTTVSFDGIFVLFMLVSLCTIIIGIFEQIVHRKCQRYNTHRYWKLMNKLINAKRYYLMLK